MSSILSSRALKVIEMSRKIILRVGVWTLIGGVIMGAVLILIGGESESSEIIVKVMGTMFIVALTLMVSTNNFRRITSENVSAVVFALIGLICNLVCATLWIILCWDPMKFIERGYGLFGFGISGITKAAVAFTLLSILGLLGSNTMAIYEGEKRGVIKPLKITATVCAVYTIGYSIVMIFRSDFGMTEIESRFGILAGFTAFVGIIIVIAAMVVAGGEKRRRAEEERMDRERKSEEYEKAVIASVKAGNVAVGGHEGVVDAPHLAKTEEELRAEIEEQVRREMIEKEVREKMEAEMKAGAGSGAGGAAASGGDVVGVSGQVSGGQQPAGQASVGGSDEQVFAGTFDGQTG